MNAALPRYIDRLRGDIETTAFEQSDGERDSLRVVARCKLVQDIRMEKVAKELVALLVGQVALAQVCSRGSGELQVGVVGGRKVRLQLLANTFRETRAGPFG